MKQIKYEVQVVVNTNKCSEEELGKQIAYVLSVFLQDYCEYVGRPEIGEIRVLKANTF